MRNSHPYKNPPHSICKLGRQQQLIFIRQKHEGCAQTFNLIWNFSCVGNALFLKLVPHWNICIGYYYDTEHAGVKNIANSTLF